LESLEERLTPAAGVQEQYMLDLINRFRQNPAAELSLLLNSTDPYVNQDLSFFGVDRSVLAAQWATLSPVPPLAWNDALGSSALAHSQAMLAAQDQSHQVAGEADLATRVTNAGYTNFTLVGENIFAFAHSLFEAEASFAIDWGNNPPTGIQNPPGHRNNLMNPLLREVGIGIVTAPNGSSMGPLLFTQDLGSRSTIGNPFLLGTVFADANHDGFFEPGEQLGGVNVTISGQAGTFQATTTAAGGYQIQVPAGTYQVTASGGALGGTVTRTVVVGTDNVEADFTQPQLLPPTFTGPATSGTNTTPTFSWTATSGATQYDLWVATAAGQQVIRNQNLTTTTLTPATPLSAGSYQAWIRVTTAAGTSSWSPVYGFTIVAPAAPTFSAPSGTITNPTPTFNWSASTDAIRYDLWVSNVTTGQTQIIRQQNLTTNSFTPTSALPGGSYQAWVQAFNNAGNSSGWSATLNFAISGPAAPIFTAPTGSSTNNSPTFTWTATAGANRYDLWVSNLSTGQDQFIRQQNLTTTSFTPAPLPAGSYTAWVQAFSAAGSLGGWSSGLSFTIVAPSPPTLTGPASVVTTTTPTFTWNATAGATQYDIWADNATTGQAQVVRQTVTATSFTPANPVPRGQYNVWIRAANSAGSFGPWSTGYSFLIDTTAPAIPTFTAPAGSTAILTPTFSWSASAGAASYDLWVNNLTTGQTQIIRQQNLMSNSFTPANPLPVGSYVAWVQAFDNTNQTRGWSNSLSFTITLPAAPTPLGPTGSTTNTLATFSWSAVTGAALYDLWVDNVGTGQMQIIRQQSLAATSFTPTTALAKGTYRFWVRALNATGNAGVWSVETDFTIS
jgi:hypothetical protein